MNSNITLHTPGHRWTETLYQLGDQCLAWADRLVRRFALDTESDLGEIIHEVQVRRLAAHGCNGQALI
jgi:hypothetical protein